MYGTYCRLGVHVSASYREVIRAARKKLKKSAFRREQREARHAFYRDMLRYHADAQGVVRDFRL